MIFRNSWKRNQYQPYMDQYQPYMKHLVKYFILVIYFNVFNKPIYEYSLLLSNGELETQQQQIVCTTLRI